MVITGSQSGFWRSRGGVENFGVDASMCLRVYTLKTVFGPTTKKLERPHTRKFRKLSTSCAAKK